MSTKPRVVVVGGGVIGLSCAYHLARRGADVEVLERDRVGSGASWGNAGTVSAGHPPLNRPGRIGAALRQMVDPTSPLYVKPRWDPALWRWLLGFARHCTEEHVEHAMRVMAPLGKDALRLFEELLLEENIRCGYRSDGYYDVCSTDEGLAGARHEAAIIERYGYHPEVLDGVELRRREPGLGPSVVGGVFYPEAATLQPAQFLAGLAKAVLSRGGVIREGAAVSGIEVASGRVRGVRVRVPMEPPAGGPEASIHEHPAAFTGENFVAVTDKTSVSGYDARSEASTELVSADAVVVATGAVSPALAREVAVRLPVMPGKGYHRDVAIGPNGAPALSIACVLNETSVFCTPMGDYVRFAGTMEFSGMNDDLRPDRLRQLTRAARAAFPQMGTARPISEWVGQRPMSVDGLPIVGPLAGVDGLSVATGHGMLGLTLGPVTGEMIANLVIDGGDARLPPLSPGRFS